MNGKAGSTIKEKEASPPIVNTYCWKVVKFMLVISTAQDCLLMHGMTVGVIGITMAALS